MVHKTARSLNSMRLKFAPTEMVYFVLDGEPGIVRSVSMDAQGVLYSVLWSDRTVMSHFEHELTDTPFAGLDGMMGQGDGDAATPA